LIAINPKIRQKGEKKMKRSYAWFMSLLSVVVFAGTVQATILYEQLPGPSSSQENISSQLDVFGRQPGFICADDFQLSSGGYVTDIHWWGESFSGDNDFQFTFYADSAGLPGSVLLTTGGTLTMSSANPGSPFDPVSFYESDLETMFTALPGTTYWVSVFNAADDASWLWLRADSVGNSSVHRRLDLSTWRGSPDLAFQLTGDPIPEPATMLLLGTGFVGLAGFRRKFRK
jgi:hypothetical protein